MQLLEDVRVEWMHGEMFEGGLGTATAECEEGADAGGPMVGFWVIVELVRGGLLWRRWEEGGGGIDVDGIGLECMPVTPIDVLQKKTLH